MDTHLLTAAEGDELLTRCALLASLLRCLWAEQHRERQHDGRWQACALDPCARIRERLTYAGMRGAIFEDEDPTSC